MDLLANGDCRSIVISALDKVQVGNKVFATGEQIDMLPNTSLFGAVVTGMGSIRHSSGSRRKKDDKVFSAELSVASWATIQRS